MWIYTKTLGLSKQEDAERRWADDPQAKMRSEDSIAGLQTTFDVYKHDV
jgi:hypothetical protein